MEYLQFKIDGEFVCNLARSWFWEENQTYEKCEELLLDCLITDELTLEERKEIVVQILEGRMKLVGINTLDLVEDGELIRPLSDKIIEQQKKAIIKEIKQEIERNALYYVDKYAIGKDLEDYEDFASRKTIYKETPEEVVEWIYSKKNSWTGKYTLPDEYFDYHNNSFNKFTYLMNPVLVYEIFKSPLSKVDEYTKYELLYQYWSIHNDIPKEITSRQKLYKAYKLKSELPKSSNVEISGANKSSDDICYIGISDEFISAYGLIDKRGNYYSCTFGGHSAKVHSIMREHPQWFSKTKEEMEWYFPTAKESDIVYDLGWVIVHNPSIMGDPYFDLKDSIVATKSQIKTAFDYMAHFNKKTMGGINNLMKDEESYEV